MPQNATEQDKRQERKNGWMDDGATGSWRNETWMAGENDVETRTVGEKET